MKQDKDQVYFSQIDEGYIFCDLDGAYYLRLPPETKVNGFRVNAVMLGTGYAHQFRVDDLIIRKSLNINTAEAAPEKEESCK